MNIRNLFQIALFVLGIFFVTMGAFLVISEIMHTESIKFQNTFKAGIAGLFWGIVLIFIVIKKRYAQK